MELRVRAKTAKRIISKQEDYITDRKKVFNEYLREVNDLNMSKLADYVVQRRVVLDFLEASIRLLPTGNYAAEDQIHQIVCPMRTTSDDVPIDQMNLWVLDDRLAYHHYLASDRKIKNADKTINVNSNERPDVILFNHLCAFADKAFGSIVILEFKKPMRDNYTEEENPVSQVVRYVRRIRNKEELDKNGRPISVHENTPFFAYVICDLTPKLRQYLQDEDYKMLPDGDGYFDYHSAYRLYVEIVSFDKLLKDANQRNTAFFDKLHLPVG